MLIVSEAVLIISFEGLDVLDVIHNLVLLLTLQYLFAQAHALKKGMHIASFRLPECTS